jgi:DNA-directed RNA polymerase specialized sigma24 family protein
MDFGDRFYQRPEAGMSTIGTLTLRIQDLRSPDARQRDEAARVIWDHFEARLRSLVRRHLDNRIRRREDEHDILQSMYASFCHGQLEGKDTPASRQELWRLLVRITLCKVVNTANRHLAACRDVRREGPSAVRRDDSNVFPLWMLDQVDRMETGAHEKLVAIEELDRILHALPEDLRQVVLWRLDGYTNAEISAMLGRTVRSVELKLQLIRKRLSSLPAEPVTTAAD